ncbi:hypothetical protein ACFE04_014439 [Oxalis oulophora]
MASNKENNAEADEKVSKILKLIKSKSKGKSVKKEAELVKLVQDLHKHYQSLYGKNDGHIKEDGVESKAKDHEEKGQGSIFPSSGSEYYSSEDIEGTNFKSTQSEPRDSEKETSDSEPSRSSNREKKLKCRLRSMKLELKSLNEQKKYLHAQMEKQKLEAEQLTEKNNGLESRVLELESILVEKGDEKSDLLKKLQDNETKLTPKIGDLMQQLVNLQKELDSLRAEKGELEGNMASKNTKNSAQIKNLTDKINTMQRELDLAKSEKTELELLLETKNKQNEESDWINQLEDLKQELESVQSKKTELESQIEEKTKETSESMIEIGTLKIKLARRNAIELRMLEEREGLLSKIKDLELEVDKFNSHKKELEDQMKKASHKTDQLKREYEGMIRKIGKLEGTLKEKAEKLCDVEKKYDDKETEDSTLINSLEAQSDNLQQELSSLQEQKSQLEAENANLRSKIADLETVLKQHETTSVKSNEQQKQIKHLSSGSRLNLHVTERKMEELAEEFRKKCEDSIRILSRRILVAEQTHFENKENYKRTSERLEQENKMLESELRKLKEVLKGGSDTLARFDHVVKKLECNGEYVDRIFKMSNEMINIKSWVMGSNNKNKQLQHSFDCLVGRLDEKEEQEFLLREKVWKLEAKLGKEGGDKLNLMKAVNQLEKKAGDLEKKISDKEVRLSDLGEEKREAIRQLCLQVDYHRDRSDRLKDVISKMKARCRQP